MAAAGGDAEADYIEIETSIVPDIKACDIGVPLYQYRLALPFIYSIIMKRFKHIACLYVEEGFKEFDFLYANMLEGAFHLIEDDKGNYYLSTRKPTLSRYMPRKRCRFHAAKIGLVSKTIGGHAILALYDSLLDVLELYDPAGLHTAHINPKSIKSIKELMTSLTGFDVINSTTMIFEDMIEKSFKESSSRPEDPGGYCSVWALWLLYTRLLYSDRDIGEIIANSEDKNISGNEIMRGFVREGVNEWKRRNITFSASEDKDDLEDKPLSKSNERKMREIWEVIFEDEGEEFEPEIVLSYKDRLIQMIKDHTIDDNEIIRKIERKNPLGPEFLLNLTIKEKRYGLLNYLMKSRYFVFDFLILVDIYGLSDDDLLSIIPTIRRNDIYHIEYLLDRYSYREIGHDFVIEMKERYVID